ncbi:hypothetical protein [Paraburkholderia domus]|uniref:hypothetical protein n=1 Tax=Paraburkholderia domus TaxID=2793075 RepID=UPI0019142957|nr:hypothetical protein [Paraburkholderia domus]MBK5064822.1 hypothetical protein [Burkholderia sp. R-70199]CAE6956824.1 hypothetical protein R70199_07019 [Paraburkholderia domus]
MVLVDPTSLFTFSWDDLRALDLSQPASWLMVGVMVIACIVGGYLGCALYPYFEKIDDKLIELLGGNE